MDEKEKWLAKYTFKCPLGRLRPETCKELRSRPTLKEWATGKRKFEQGAAFKTKNLTKPRQCESCEEWRKIMGTCNDCGQEFMPWKSGCVLIKHVCKKCFTERRKAEREFQKKIIEFMKENKELIQNVIW